MSRPGRCVSKRRYFYGFRVKVITTSEGGTGPVLHPSGYFADITAFKSMHLDLPEGSRLYADAAYTCYEVEDLLKECQKVQLRCRKSNSKRKDEPHMAFLKDHYRKRIETTSSGITGFLPKKIHAVTAQGFILKIILFIFAYTLTQVIE